MRVQGVEQGPRESVRPAPALQGPPRELAVSDLDRIVFRTNFTNAKQDTHEITLDTFDRQSQALLRRTFTEPVSFRPGDGAREKVTKQAAERFGQLAGSLGSRGHDPHEVAHFLVQSIRWG